MVGSAAIPVRRTGEGRGKVDFGYGRFIYLIYLFTFFCSISNCEIPKNGDDIHVAVYVTLPTASVRFERDGETCCVP